MFADSELVPVNPRSFFGYRILIPDPWCRFKISKWADRKQTERAEKTTPCDTIML
jgi:hypothetical protein